jgi:hypothetical protein
LTRNGGRHERYTVAVHQSKNFTTILLLYPPSN